MARIAKYAELLCPFPTITRDGTLKNGARLGQCQMCTKCQSKDCRQYGNTASPEDVQHFVCPYGLSVFVLRFDGSLLISNGLVDPALNKQCRKGLRRALRNH